MEESEKAELAALILKGSKIEAIKFYREATGFGLKEAKEAVEKLEREMRAEIPEKFAKASSGCGVASVLGLVVLSGLAIALF